MENEVYETLISWFSRRGVRMTILDAANMEERVSMFCTRFNIPSKPTKHSGIEDIIESYPREVLDQLLGEPNE